MSPFSSDKSLNTLDFYIAVSFTQSIYRVNEDADSVELTVEIDRTVKVELVIPLLVTTNTVVQSQTLTIPAGSSTATIMIPIAAPDRTITVAIDTENDLIKPFTSVPDRTITVAIDTSNLPDGVAVGTNPRVVIRDDDGGSILRIRSKVFLEGPL